MKLFAAACLRNGGILRNCHNDSQRRIRAGNWPGARNGWTICKKALRVASARLSKTFKTAGENLRQRLRRLRPRDVLRQRHELLSQRQRRLGEQAGHQLERLRHRCDELKTRLRLLGPDQVLARGYSITLDAASSNIIRSARETRPGQELKTKLKTGEVRSIVAPS
jgi:exonuclease VII large subunit